LVNNKEFSTGTDEKEIKTVIKERKTQHKEESLTGSSRGAELDSMLPAAEGTIS